MPWQPAAIVYPDVELVCTAGIRELLAARGQANVFVGNRIPDQRRPRMVIFNRDGGATRGLFDNPRMRCRVWAETDQDANDLALLIVALMQLLIDGAPVLAASTESGPYDVPDESQSVQKYLLFNLRTRGEALT